MPTPTTATAKAPDTAVPVATRWRGVPPHERPAERRRLLVGAAFGLLGTAGISGTTVRGVCEATKLNPRYFYESFADLDELLVAVFDQVAHEAFGAMLETVTEVTEGSGDDGPDPLALTRASIGTFVHHVTSDPRRAQVLFIEGLGNETLSRRRFEAMHVLTQLLEQDAAARVASPAALDPVVKIAANLVVGGMAELMIAWLHGRLDISLDQLVDDTAALFVATGEAANRIAEARARPAKRRR